VLKLLSLSANTLWAVLVKDAACELRNKYALTALIMFALIALSCVSMTLNGAFLEPPLAAALLWVVIFFAAMAGLARVFAAEQESGTLLALRIYASSASVLGGKLIFNFIMLFGLTIFIAPLFLVLININNQVEWFSFTITLFLGAAGLAAAATLTAAMVSCAEGKQTLFAVITFPLILPLLLSAVSATALSLSGLRPDYTDILFLLGYDLALIAVAVLLFDYLWYE
jgi:heme exporter protein B